MRRRVNENYKLEKMAKKLSLCSNRSRRSNNSRRNNSSSDDSSDEVCDSDSSDASSESESDSRTRKKHGSNNVRKGDRSFGLILKRDYNMKFDGASSKTPIERFLYRIQEIAKDHGVHKDQLVGQLGTVLHNEAVDFYWTFRERNKDVRWSDLKKAFIYRFSDRRTQEDVWHSLDARKQKANESFLEFYNAIVEISLSLKEPIRDSKLIRLLKDNMRPSLQLQLAGKVITSLPKLINKCISIEETWKRIKCRPELCHMKNVNELCEVNSSFCEFQKETEEVRADEMKNGVEAIHHQSNTSRNCGSESVRSDSGLKCWNCLKPGHSFNDCGVAKVRDFCYGCGKTDTLKPNCSVCKLKAGNGIQGMALRVANPGVVQNPITLRQTSITTEEAATNTDPELRRNIQNR